MNAPSAAGAVSKAGARLLQFAKKRGAEAPRLSLTISLPTKLSMELVVHADRHDVIHRARHELHAGRGSRHRREYFVLGDDAVVQVLHSHRPIIGDGIFRPETDRIDARNEARPGEGG